MIFRHLSNFQFSLLILASTLSPLCLCGETHAQLDPQKDSAYQLQVVVRIANHPPFTPAFKDQVRRELRAGLQDAFADLARVEILDAHPQLKEIDSKGLSAALDSWKEVSSRKTHFVLIDFKDGQ